MFTLPYGLSGTMHKVRNTFTIIAEAFWTITSHCETSSTCGDTILRDIGVTWIISGDKDPCTLVPRAEQWPANEIYRQVPCMCTHLPTINEKAYLEDTTQGRLNDLYKYLSFSWRGRIIELQRCRQGGAHRGTCPTMHLGAARHHVSVKYREWLHHHALVDRESGVNNP